jgi:hypothetical protein
LGSGVYYLQFPDGNVFGVDLLVRWHDEPARFLESDHGPDLHDVGEAAPIEKYFFCR